MYATLSIIGLTQLLEELVVAEEWRKAPIKRISSVYFLYQQS